MLQCLNRRGCSSAAQDFVISLRKEADLTAKETMHLNDKQSSRLQATYGLLLKSWKERQESTSKKLNGGLLVHCL
jgi:hypothetical protein